MAVILLLSVVAVPAASIDALLSEAWQQHGIVPAPVCDDATFLRRISLDLIGRIPTTKELSSFLAQPDRNAKIDELLQRPEFSRHLAETMTASLVGYDRETPADREVLLQWLEAQLEKHTGFDRIATSLISAEGQSALHGPVNFVVRHREEAGAQVCRQLLGVRLDCARCHDHPFARWTQDDLASMTRFFEAMRFEEVSERNIRVSDRPAEAGEDEIPRFLTGARPQTSQWRRELALFVTRSKPFARNFANRIWYQLMGRGIVDPPGDFNQQNQPSHPELLEFLATKTHEQKFDVRQLVRQICNSDTYQRESKGEADPAAVEQFARRVIKPLTPEQLYESYRVVLGKKPPISRRDFVREFLGETVDEDFLLTWKSRETVQSLLKRMTADAPFHQAVKSIDDAFQRVLSRTPTTRDIELCRDQSLGVVVFCLVQSNEFVFNH